jgi:quercetin dioxygenase-like cupin family protein
MINRRFQEVFVKNLMRHPMRSTAAILAAGTLALAGATAAADSANTTPAAVTRVELAHSDVPGTDLETRLYLITYPPGAAAPLHHHPVEGLGYILEGAARSAYGQNPPVTLTEGQSFVDLADVPHTLFVNTNPRGPLRFLIAYTVKKGAPVIEIP